MGRALRLRLDLASRKRSEPLDRRGRVVDGLWLGESSGAQLGRKPFLHKRQSLLDEIVGQVDRNPGRLAEVPSMGKQIGETGLWG